MRTLIFVGLLAVGCSSETGEADPSQETGGSVSVVATTGGDAPLLATGGSSAVVRETGGESAQAAGGHASTGGQAATGGQASGPYIGSPESHDNGQTCDYSTIYPSYCYNGGYDVGGNWIAPKPCTDPCLPYCNTFDPATGLGGCDRLKL